MNDSTPLYNIYTIEPISPGIEQSGVDIYVSVNLNKPIQLTFEEIIKSKANPNIAPRPLIQDNPDRCSILSRTLGSSSEHPDTYFEGDRYRLTELVENIKALASLRACNPDNEKELERHAINSILELGDLWFQESIVEYGIYGVNEQEIAQQLMEQIRQTRLCLQQTFVDILEGFSSIHFVSAILQLDIETDIIKPLTAQKYWMRSSLSKPYGLSCKNNAIEHEVIRQVFDHIVSQ